MNAFSGELQPEFGVLSSGKKTTTSSKSKVKGPSATKERLHDTTALRVKQQAQASTSPKIRNSFIQSPEARKMMSAKRASIQNKCNITRRGKTFKKKSSVKSKYDDSAIFLGTSIHQGKLGEKLGQKLRVKSSISIKPKRKKR